MVLSGCGDGGTEPNNDPAFSGLSSLGTKPYVAYAWPDPYEKFDTLSLSFNYNSSKISSIKVEATLDNGATWFSVATPAPNSSNKATVKWVPKEAAAAVINFFGFKTGKLKVSDPGSGEYLESEPFTLIGALPLMPHKPLGGETYGMNDTVAVEYSANTDLISNILVFFRTDNMSNWHEFLDDAVLDFTRPPIKKMMKWFVPAELDSTIQAEAQHFSVPIKILLQDYSSPLAVYTTDYITITP
ncbi:MAG: hypothetical protein JXA71_15330 [Chitinispirillaceae bacterium]|nr:hypothetical protein [Chitinispirillaceae bacterium]